MNKKSLFGIALAFATVLSFTNVSAVEIENLKIVPTTSELSIQWDALSENDSIQTDGYALQWGQYQTDVKIDQNPRQTISKSLNYISVRAADFARNTKYYFRVYSYTKDEQVRGYELFNGSKILEWEWKSNGEVETRIIEPSDPVITTTADSAVFNFGQLRVVPFDKSLQLSWSRANLASHEYTGFIIALSESADLSNTVYELEAGKSNFKGFLTGLTPEKKYYAGGYFYKKENGVDRKFGLGTVVSFTMAKAFNSYQVQSYNRTLARLKTTGLGSIGNVGETSTTVTTSSSTNLTGKNEIENRIRQLESEIQTRQSELRLLKSKLNSLFGTTTTSTTRTSLRERLLKMLNR